MWNKLVALAHNHSCQRLALALLISVALHALLFGGFDFAVPISKKEMHAIAVRIQMQKMAVNEVESPMPQPAAPEPVMESLKEAHSEPAPAPASIIETPVVAKMPSESQPATQPLIESTVPEPSQDESQPVDASLVMNENAYQFVETKFDVRTKIDGSVEGSATITYNVIDGNHYRLQWFTEASGFAALLFPDLLQVSEGLLIKTGLQPVSYLYQFGNKAKKTRTANFDWFNKKVIMQTSKGIKTEELPEGAQDLLSFMYQFMHVAPLQNMQIPIATGKTLRVYTYSFEGEENINTAFGEIKTMRIMHSGVASDETTELWLALDYQYVPVKIRKIENNGDIVEMLATRINSNRPAINN